MASIPTIAMSGVPAHQLGVKMNVSPMLEASRASEEGWRSTEQTAQVLFKLAEQRQDHIDRGILASEDSIRKKTARVVEEYMENNEGNPESWKQFHNETWKAYELDRKKREKSWRPKLVREENIRLLDYKTETDIRFETLQNRARIRKANGQIEANANLRLDNGDVRGAMEQINSLNLDPTAKQQKLEQVINGGIYRAYDRLLTDTSKLPPAQQLEELGKIENGLTARDTKGNYRSGTMKDEKGNVIGMMGEPARLDVLRNARAAMRHANVQMAQTGSGLVRKIELGDDPTLVFQQALAKGEITPEVAAVFIPEAKQAIDKKQDVVAARQDRAAQSVLTEIQRPTGTRMTMDELERRRAIGITRPNDPQGITADVYNRSRDELAAIQESEWAYLGNDKRSVRVELEKKLGQGITTKFWDKAQMSPKEQRDTLELISLEKASVGTKAKLLQLFFEVQKWDLRESEISDVDGDRDVSPEEKTLRTSLIERYRSNASALGATALGARYMADMEEIGNWYRSNSNATPAQRADKAKEFSEKLGQGIDREAGSSILGGLPSFQ